MTKEADIAGLYEQFNEIHSLRQKITRLLNKNAIDHIEAWAEVKTLVDGYEDARILFERIKGDSVIAIRQVKFIGEPAKPSLTLQKIRVAMGSIRIECKKALGFLEKLSHPSITQEEIKELHSLRGELEKISTKIDVNIDKNVEMAIEEYETGHYLSSALLSSRVIVSQLDKIAGKGDEEKIKELKDSGRIKNKRKDTVAQLVKASRLSRHFLSHNPNIFAEPDEALSLLSDGIRIVKLVNE
jgi:hypothetical protein